jgi:hypothetical protein
LASIAKLIGACSRAVEGAANGLLIVEVHARTHARRPPCHASAGPGGVRPAQGARQNLGCELPDAPSAFALAALELAQHGWVEVDGRPRHDA